MFIILATVVLWATCKYLCWMDSQEIAKYHFSEPAFRTSCWGFWASVRQKSEKWVDPHPLPTLLPPPTPIPLLYCFVSQVFGECLLGIMCSSSLFKSFLYEESQFSLSHISLFGALVLMWLFHRVQTFIVTFSPAPLTLTPW